MKVTRTPAGSSLDKYKFHARRLVSGRYKYTYGVLNEPGILKGKLFWVTSRIPTARQVDSPLHASERCRFPWRHKARHVQRLLRDVCRLCEPPGRETRARRDCRRGSSCASPRNEFCKTLELTSSSPVQLRNSCESRRPWKVHLTNKRRLTRSCLSLSLPSDYL